jgi:hypothetical protein
MISCVCQCKTNTLFSSSGSGKTTFLNDVHKAHECIYIRQYHNIRPYITVSKVPNFDPTELPYWSIYQKEGKDKRIQVGGTMAGEVTNGLSGGQRKLFLFELIYQRTKDETGLLILLDEPFAGVTDDFVPFIIDRLEHMKKMHNVLVVTNDHVAELTNLADTIIRLSAVDRDNVLVNDSKTERQIAIMALSLGDEYTYQATGSDWGFFLDVEIVHNRGIHIAVIYAVLSYALFLATFWNSSQDSASLVLIANELIGYYSVLPFLLSLPDWRHYVDEESEALLHSNKTSSKIWKTYLAMALLFFLALFQYGMVNTVIDGMGSIEYFFGIFFDGATNQFPYIVLGLYSSLPNEQVYALSSMPFLLMIFFSTTFSPGAGLPYLKELRYLFSRFYFWCIVPGIQDEMEDCPANRTVNMVALAITGTLVVWLFLAAMLVQRLVNKLRRAEQKTRRETISASLAFRSVQLEIYGSGALNIFHGDDIENPKALPTECDTSSGSESSVVDDGDKYYDC